MLPSGEENFFSKTALFWLFITIRPSVNSRPFVEDSVYLTLHVAFEVAEVVLLGTLLKVLAGALVDIMNGVDVPVMLMAQYQVVAPSMSVVVLRPARTPLLQAHSVVSGRESTEVLYLPGAVAMDTVSLCEDTTLIEQLVTRGMAVVWVLAVTVLLVVEWPFGPFRGQRGSF